MPVGTIWTPEEDERLAQLVNIYGPKKWSQIASELGTKGSKQCRRRWKNFISLEERKQGSWTPEEDAMLLDGHRRHGNKWTLIAQEIGGRTDNAVKNRWAALEKKRKADEEPTDLVRRHAPMLRPQNDLLGVRRVICKDQPRYRDPLMGSGPVDEALWAQEMREDDQQLQQFQPLQQQQQQLPYAISSSFMVQQPMQQTDTLNNMPITRKPVLIINIPGAAAAEPQLPYSQRSQGIAPFMGQKDVQLAQDLQPIELPQVRIHADDESLLSTSRQAAQAAIPALNSPSEEPGAINSLYKYLCSATPQDTTAQQLPGGRRSPPPWAGSSSTRPMEQQQPQQQPPQVQLLPPPPLLHSQLPPMQQQQMVQTTTQLPQVPQYQQLPVTGQIVMQPQQQLPMIPLQQGPMQHQQQPQHLPVPLSAPMHFVHMPQQQHAPSIPVVSDMSQHSGFPGSQPGSMQGMGMVQLGQPVQHMQQGQMLPPSTMAPQHQQQPPVAQMRYPHAAWHPHHQQQQQQLSYNSPSLPQRPHYMPPVMSGGMPAPGYQSQQLQPQQLQSQQLPSQVQLQMQLQQPEPRFDEQQKQWGPEELRQLLDLLGDQPPPHQHQPLQPVHQGLMSGATCVHGSVPGSVPGSADMSPNVPEEEVDQVNNGHGTGRSQAVLQPGSMNLTGPEAGYPGQC